MRIDKIHIQGFRGIDELKMDLNPKFNLIIGENGSGKTAILEAISVAMGALFLGMPGASTRTIRDEDIRYFKTPEGTFEYAQKTLIDVMEGVLNSPIEIVSSDKKIKPINWHKERNGINGSTLHGNNSLIKKKAQDIVKFIRDPKRSTVVSLPVLTYYSTSRLWKEARENKTKKKFPQKLPSRFRAYNNALEAKSTFKIMLDWFESKFLDLAVNKQTTFQLDCVKNTIIKNTPGATDVKWVFEEDRIQTLYICFENNVEIPFNFLSDGYRNTIAIFSDLAWRCVTLNPHFGVEACSLSEGMVLIDEIDLHLHPSWQKTIVKQLKETFPKIQFVATTHSPFIIQEMEDGEVFKINDTADGILDELKGVNKLGIEDIAEDVQDVDSPNMSLKREEMFEAAENYYQLLEKTEGERNPEELQKLKDALDELSERYSDDVAYYAFLKQERIARGIK
jgi:predicted ATP-binding protein involved in virulence